MVSVRVRVVLPPWVKGDLRCVLNSCTFSMIQMNVCFCTVQTQFVTAQDHTQKVMEIQQQLEGSDIRVRPHTQLLHVCSFHTCPSPDIC